MANREIWEGFQRSARQGFVETLQAGGDPVIAALHLAAEDDALSTKSTVELPVPAFSKRLDSTVQQLQNHINALDTELTPDAAAQLCRTFLFETMGFTVASQQLELYSPYRVYMHKVLSQRCGTPEALAALLAALIQRAQHKGLVPPFAIEMGLAGVGKLPRVRIAGSADSSPLGVTWHAPMECVVLCLETLKRSNWSWVWDTRARDCFREPADAFLGAYGRAGVGSGTVGVMQATGRPFGDLRMALLATERLAVVRGGTGGGRDGAREVRDQGVLLCHMRRFAEAKQALEAYRQWLAANERLVMDVPDNVKLLDVQGEDGEISQDEVERVDRLLIKVSKLLLEDTFAHS